MKLSAILVRLDELGIKLPVQIDADDSATIADAAGVEIFVVDPNGLRADGAVFEIAALLGEIINLVLILDMPENPTPSELGRWAATQHDLPEPFSLGLVRKIYNERRAARLRAWSGGGGLDG